MALRAGVAELKITPPVGMDLTGYADREGPSTTVHDDLWCRGLVLDDGATRLGIVALDLLGVDFPLDAAIRREAAPAGGLAPECLLVNCSHTHAGPAVARLTSLGSPNEAYIASLPGKVAEVMGLAAGRLAQVSVTFGAAPVRVGINRRERTADGSIILGRNPEGIRDERVRVLDLRDGGGETLAVIFNYACHGTTMGGENHEISAEWMGAACQQLRTRLPGRPVPMFLQGCCGNINPEREHRGFDQVAQLGGRMADAVLAAAGSAQPVRAEPLRARLSRTELSLQDPPSPEVARANLAQAEAAAKQVRQAGRHPYVARARDALVAYAQQILRLAEAGERDYKLPFAVQALAIGDAALVGLSGEVFFDFAGEIEAASPFPHTVVLGYSNGCTGYVPTPQAIAEGGYEPDASFRYYETLPLAPEAGAEMVEAAVGVLRELAQV